MIAGRADQSIEPILDDLVEANFGGHRNELITDAHESERLCDLYSANDGSKGLQGAIGPETGLQKPGADRSFVERLHHPLTQFGEKLGGVELGDAGVLDWFVRLGRH